MIVIGLMSGTSADGIDAAVLEIEGRPPHLRWKVLAHVYQPHPPELRGEIFACFRPETGSVDRLCALNFALGRAFGQAARSAVEAAQRITSTPVSLIGSHGQTIWHIPNGQSASTLQLGEPAVIAEMTGLPVISNFRVRDMAAGGQGAPLVAYVDQLLFRAPGIIRALQNIGGIANVTYLPPQEAAESPFAFDTGPGNMLIDDAVVRATHGAQMFDLDGKIAASGSVNQELLAQLMDDPYLRQAPPKTTGREHFGLPLGEQVWQWSQQRGLSPEDLIATLTEFAACSIARAYRDFLPHFPQEVIVSGGGARNPVLMKRLTDLLDGAHVMTSEALGLGVEAKEAAAFAVLAYESWHGRPGNLPEATGAQRAVVLGNLTPQPLPTCTETEPREKRILPLTESRNPSTLSIDIIPTQEMVRLMNNEDRRVAEAVSTELESIAEAIDRIALRMRTGGRLIYMGAGTSGRLGFLDASECMPTFSIPPDKVVGLIAGGPGAITQAIEGAEDDETAGEADIARLNINNLDCVVGLAASGRTPYVLAGLREARRRGALTISVACNHPTPIEALADVMIAPVVGPEVVAGSTRMKAGTAQKMVLNMVSTGVMIRLGKTYSNLMVDMQPTNHKLRERARRVVAEACGISLEEASQIFDASGGEVKTAIVAHLAGIPVDEARKRLEAASGVVRLALEGKDNL